MLKVGKPLTKEELLKSNYDLGKENAKLEIQVKLLKEIMVDRDLKPPMREVLPPGFLYEYVYPWYRTQLDETGDPLPIMPNTTCEVRVY